LHPSTDDRPGFPTHAFRLGVQAVDHERDLGRQGVRAWQRPEGLSKRLHTLKLIQDGPPQTPILAATTCQPVKVDAVVGIGQRGIDQYRRDVAQILVGRLDDLQLGEQKTAHNKAALREGERNVVAHMQMVEHHIDMQAETIGLKIDQPIATK
jgi:hypothetical protein